MGDRHSEHIDYESCVAYFRSALPSRRMREVAAYLATHPDESSRARADAAHEHAMKRSLDGVLDEPLPPRLQITPRSRPRPWPGRLALAIVVVLSVAGGWWLGGIQMAPGRDATFVERVISAARQPPKGPATRATAHEPIDIPAPDLSTRGYRLVRQQQLGNAEPKLIEFVYRNASGQRLRIYAEATVRRRVAPTVRSRNGVSLAQWREDGTRYALVGDVPGVSLRALARAARTDAATGQPRLVGAAQWRDDGARSDYTHGRTKLFYTAPTTIGPRPNPRWPGPARGRATSR